MFLLLQEVLTRDIMDSLKYQAILAKIVMFLVQRVKLDDQWCYILELC